MPVPVCAPRVITSSNRELWPDLHLGCRHQHCRLGTALPGLQELPFCPSSPQAGGLFLFAFKHSTSLSFFTPFSNFNHIFFYLRNSKFLQKQQNCSCFRQAPKDHIHLSSLCLSPASSLTPTLQHLEYFTSIWKPALAFNPQETRSKMKVRGGASKQSVLCYAIKQIWAGQVCSSRLSTPPWAMRQQEQSNQPQRS